MLLIWSQTNTRQLGEALHTSPFLCPALAPLCLSSLVGDNTSPLCLVLLRMAVIVRHCHPEPRPSAPSHVSGCCICCPFSPEHLEKIFIRKCFKHTAGRTGFGSEHLYAPTWVLPLTPHCTCSIACLPPPTPAHVSSVHHKPLCYWDAFPCGLQIPSSMLQHTGQPKASVHSTVM